MKNHKSKTGPRGCAFSVRACTEMEMEKQQKAQADERRSMVGTGERSEKIRTYNYPQNRVTDHRIGLTLHRPDSIMDGDLPEIIDALTAHFQAERMKNPANPAVA